MLIHVNKNRTCFIKLVDILLMNIIRLKSCKYSIYNVRYEFYTKRVQVKNNVSLKNT